MGYMLYHGTNQKYLDKFLPAGSGILLPWKYTDNVLEALNFACTSAKKFISPPALLVVYNHPGYFMDIHSDHIVFGQKVTKWYKLNILLQSTRERDELIKRYNQKDLDKLLENPDVVRDLDPEQLEDLEEYIRYAKEI